MDVLCMEDDNYVIAGRAGITDFDGFPYTYLTQFTPSFLKKSMICYQSAYPTRVKDLRVINAPSFTETLLGLLKMLLNGKSKKRVSTYSEYF